MKVPASKCEELNDLKKGKRFVEDGLSSSQCELKEKQGTLTSLNERVRKLPMSLSIHSAVQGARVYCLVSCLQSSRV